MESNNTCGISEDRPRITEVVIQGVAVRLMFSAERNASVSKTVSEILKGAYRSHVLV